MWTIPDKGEGDNDLQSILFQEYLDVLVASLNPMPDGVLSGCAITGGADMTPAVAKGSVLSNGVLLAVSAGDVTIPTAHSTNPRLDLIVVDSSGAKQVRQGTAAAAPKPPNRSANDVVLGTVYVPAGDTTIATSQIVDQRAPIRLPVVIYRTTTVETTNNTTGAIHMLNKAGSGLTIPNGLFLAGRIIRVRIGGNYLINSGTPTVAFAVAYGGTTMFTHTSSALVADADRGAFHLSFDLVAQANNDQSVAGFLNITDPDVARGTRTTGIGDIWTQAVTAEGDSAFAGAAAVDSDAANRVLEVTWTFNVANAANELVVEMATVELL